MAQLIQISTYGTAADFFKTLATFITETLGGILKTDIDAEYERVMSGTTNDRMTVAFGFPNTYTELRFENVAGKSSSTRDGIKIKFYSIDLPETHTSNAVENTASNSVNMTTKTQRTINIYYHYSDGNFYMQFGSINNSVPNRNDYQRNPIAFKLKNYIGSFISTTSYTLYNSRGATVTLAKIFDYEAINSVDYIKQVVVLNPQKIDTITTAYSTSKLVALTDYNVNGVLMSTITQNIALKG